MHELTNRQRDVFDFIERRRFERDASPSLREIADHFGFRSMTAAVDHVRALKRKGWLQKEPRLARSIRPVRAGLRWSMKGIPVYGTIPAGFAQDRKQEKQGCLSMDLSELGIKFTPRTFALEVRGDSMIGRHIVEGDHVILEHGRIPRNGDIVAALIDNESTLKTFVQEKGKSPFLKAENPKYPNLIPAAELVIQGVMVGMIRVRG